MLRFVAIAAVLLLGGCHTAQEFTRPSPDSLRLGQMTRQEVIGTYGEPTQQQTVSRTEAGLNGDFRATPSELNIVRLTYYFRDPLMMALDPAGNYSWHKRWLTFDFANDRLFAYYFASTYEAESSNFDEKKVGLLETGISTRDDVIALFGAPTGRAVFPRAAPGVEMYIYDYSEVGEARRKEKRLDVAIGDDGRVQNFNLMNETAPLSRSAPAMMPIFIPRGR